MAQTLTTRQEDTYTPAAPAKLRNGGWGARTSGRVKEDYSQAAPIVAAAKSMRTLLKVTTRSGKSWIDEYTCIATDGDEWALWEKVKTYRSTDASWLSW